MCSLNSYTCACICVFTGLRASMVGMTNQAGRTEGNFTWNYSIVGQLFHLIVLTPQNLLSFLNAQSFSSSQNYNMCIVV